MQLNLSENLTRWLAITDDDDGSNNNDGDGDDDDDDDDGDDMSEIVILAVCF